MRPLAVFPGSTIYIPFTLCERSGAQEQVGRSVFDRLCKIPQQLKNMAAGISSITSILVLQAD